MNRLLHFFVLFFPTISLASPPVLSPAWQTDTVLEQPESVAYHAKSNQLFVSNINGNPMEADGNGYISLVSIDGNIIEQHWLKGLDAPKGMTIVGNKLYIADINQLVVADINSKEISQRYHAPGAKFLNDVAADDKGNIYVSGFLTNSIYRLSNDTFERWLQSEQLEVPNGLLVENNQLLVGSWGVMTDGFATAVPGHIKTVDLASKKIASLGDASAVGNLDGLEADGNGNYYVTDWIAGKLLHITPAGISSTLITMDQGSADHTVLPQHNLIIIPMMNSAYLNAYTIKENE